MKSIYLPTLAIISVIITGCSQNEHQVAKLMGEQPLCYKIEHGIASQAERNAFSERGIDCAVYKEKKVVTKKAPPSINPNKSIANPRPIAHEVAKTYTDKEKRKLEVDAILDCSDAVRGRLAYPSTFKQKYFGTSSNLQSDGVVLVKLPFKAKNAIGMELPQLAICRMKGKIPLDVIIVNR